MTNMKNCRTCRSPNRQQPSRLHSLSRFRTLRRKWQREYATEHCKEAVPREAAKVVLVPRRAVAVPREAAKVVLVLASATAAAVGEAHDPNMDAHESCKPPGATIERTIALERAIARTAQSSHACTRPLSCADSGRGGVCRHGPKDRPPWGIRQSDYKHVHRSRTERGVFYPPLACGGKRRCGSPRPILATPAQP